MKKLVAALLLLPLLVLAQVTTNPSVTGVGANLSGVITSSGNVTSITSQTGTGSKFVVDTSPTLVTPVLGVASGTSLSLSSGVGVGLSLTGSSGTQGIVSITDTGSNGAGIQITGNGATTPTKAIRVNSGVLQVINSAYSTLILTLSDTGDLFIPGTRTYAVPDNVSASIPTVSSASTIVPTTPIAFVSGTVTVQTITAPAGCTRGCQITLIPTGLFVTNTSGNIALATVAVVNKALIMTYEQAGNKWYPSY